MLWLPLSHLQMATLCMLHFFKQAGLLPLPEPWWPVHCSGLSCDSQLSSSWSRPADLICVQVVAPVDDRSHWEVFYSYPSFSAPAFFGAAAAAAEQLPAGASAADAFEDVHELAKAVQVACNGLLRTYRSLQAFCSWTFRQSGTCCWSGPSSKDRFTTLWDRAQSQSHQQTSGT